MDIEGNVRNFPHNMTPAREQLELTIHQLQLDGHVVRGREISNDTVAGAKISNGNEVRGIAKDAEEGGVTPLGGEGGVTPLRQTEENPTAHNGQEQHGVKVGRGFEMSHLFGSDTDKSD